MRKTLLSEVIDDREKNGKVMSVSAETDDGSEFLCKLCNLAVVNAS